MISIEEIGKSLDANTKDHLVLAGDQQVNDKWRDKLRWVTSGYLSVTAGLLLSIAVDVRAIREKMERDV